MFSRNHWIYTLRLLVLLGCSFQSKCETTLEFTVPEENKPNTLVADIADQINIRKRLTSDELKQLSFSFLNIENGYTHLFDIDATLGKLSTLSKIDREKLCPFSIQCIVHLEVVAQTSSGKYFEIINVEVYIADINDNSPIFLPSIVYLNISEEVDSGTSFPIKGATDIDSGGSNSIQTYMLRNGKDVFSLDTERKLDGTLDIALKLNSNLDREKVDRYILYVYAIDGGVPQRTGTLAIEVNVQDFNDNHPLFSKSSYNVSINDTTPVRTILFTAGASDVDTGRNGDISFRLSPHQSSDVTSLFDINSHSGAIYLMGILSQKTYTFVIEAFDNGKPSLSSQAVVNIYVLDVSNQPPSVKVNVLQEGLISEKATQGVPIAHVQVSDTDSGRNGDITCITDQHQFGVEKHEERSFTIIVSKPLDRESQSHYYIIVTCKDNGSPPLADSKGFSIDILDENDNPPSFIPESYHLSVMENNIVGDSLGRFKAFDGDLGVNAEISYYLQGNIGDKFKLNEDTGQLFTKVSFDYEKESKVSFNVLAIDKGIPHLTATASVQVNVIDVNDNEPIFQDVNYTFHILEGTPPKTIGAVNVSDNDSGLNAEIWFHLKPENVPFEILFNGLIRNTRTLDREYQSSYDLTVVAQDRGQPPISRSSSVVVIVDDINDSSPRFIFPSRINHTIRVPYVVRKHSQIASILVSDPDDGRNSHLTYEIVDDDSSKLFHIDSSSGKLSLTRDLNVSQPIRYTLGLRVTDSGLPRLSSRESLYIDVVDSSHMQPAEGTKQNNYTVFVVVIASISFVLILCIITSLLLLRKRKRLKKRQDQAVTMNDLSPSCDDIEADQKDVLRSLRRTSRDEELHYVGNSLRHDEKFREKKPVTTIRPGVIGHAVILQGDVNIDEISTTDSGRGHSEDESQSRSDYGEMYSMEYPQLEPIQASDESLPDGDVSSSQSKTFSTFLRPVDGVCVNGPAQRRKYYPDRRPRESMLKRMPPNITLSKDKIYDSQSAGSLRRARSTSPSVRFSDQPDGYMTHQKYARNRSPMLSPGLIMSSLATDC